MLLCFACVETLCALELVHQSDVLYCSVLQCYGSLHVLRCFVHWTRRITATCFTVVCCKSNCLFQVRVETSVYSRKHNVSCKSIQIASVPMRSAKNDLQNTIQLQDATPLLCSTSTSTLLFSSLLHSTSTLPLPKCPLDTMMSGLGSLRHMPTGHNDLWTSD